MTLFYECRSLWEHIFKAGCFAARSQQSTVLVSVTLDRARVAVLVNQKDLYLLSLSPVAEQNVSCMNAEMPVETNAVVSALCWSLSGATLAVARLDGKLMLWTSLGVLINVIELSPYLNSISSFVFLTESAILLAAGDGQLVKYNVLTGDAASLMSVGCFHAWPQLMFHPERGICAMCGVLKDGEPNVTLWKYMADAPGLDAIYAHHAPLSAFGCWRRGLPERAMWSRLDFSPDCQGLAVSIQGLPPLILSLQNDRVSPVVLDGSALGEVMHAANGAAFWDDTTLAVTTDIGKILLLKWRVGDLELMGSKSIHEQTELVGRIQENSLLSVSVTEESVPISMVFMMGAALRSGERNLVLGMFVRQSASEHVSSLVHRGDFEAALRVADLADLPKDDIHKHMWTARESKFISFSELGEWFDRIGSEEWVIQTCMEVTSTSFDNQKRILEHGLKTLMQEGLLAGKQLLEQRVKVLRQMELLHTFEALHPGCFSSEAFDSFRSAKIEETARAFARNGNTQALQVLFKHHGYSLFPSMLAILECLPCTLTAREYKAVLPRVGMTPRKLGFVTLPSTESVKHIADSASPEIAALLDAALHERTTTGTVEEPTLSENDLSSLYSTLARRIEHETGSLSLSKSVLELGIQNGVCEGLRDQLHALTVFDAWLSVEQQFWNWSSASFAKLTVEQRIESSLQGAEMDAVMGKLESGLIPLSNSLPTENRKEFRETLIQYALQKSTELFERVISHECVHSHLFGTTPFGLSEFSNAALSAIQRVDKITEWDLIYEALDLIARQETGSTNLQDVMEDCHTAALLEKHGLHISYSRLRNLTHADGQRLLKSVLGHAMRTGGNWSDAEWDSLLSDLMTIALRISQLSKADCELDGLKQAYFQTLLRASRFALADYYMEHSLNLETAEEIAWEIGREVLCSITDLDNMASIDQAKACFDLFPSSHRARAEIQKLKALTCIRSHFSVTMLPLEMEQLSAKSDVIETILAKSEKHYRRRDALLTICQDLQFSEQDFFDAWSRLCREAVHQKDLNRAREFLQDLREKEFPQAWTLALEIVQEDKHQQYLSLEEKQEMWSFVISHCDSGLQKCIEEMEEASDEAEGVEPTTASEAFSCHEDAYLYLADALYRSELKGLDTSVARQKCSVYDFVHGAVDSVNNTTSESAEFARSLLESSPHEIVEMLKNASQFLHEGRESTEDMSTFEHHLQELQEQDQLHAAARRIQSVLPGLDTVKFGVASQRGYREQIMLELAKYAAELLYSEDRLDRQVRECELSWQDVLGVALEQGAILDVHPWNLHFGFVSTVCGLVDGKMPSLEPAILASESELMKKKSDYIKQILRECWSDAVHPNAVANLIHICVRCLEADDSVESSTTTALALYASKIGDHVGNDSHVDFRLPVHSVLHPLVARVFGCHLEWSPCTSELQHIYTATSGSNHEHLINIYQILEGIAVTDGEHTACVSDVCLVIAVKQLVSSTERGLLTDRGYWKALLPHLLEGDIETLIEFAVFHSSDALLEGLSGLDVKTKQQIGIWDLSHIAEDQRLTMLIVLLEEAILLLDQSDWTESHTALEKWKVELKRLRRLHATQDFCGMGVAVAGDDFNENLKNIVRQMIHTGKDYSAMLEAMRQFAERSDEDSSEAAMEPCMAETLVEWTLECLASADEKLEVIFSALNARDPSAALQKLQETVWHHFMDSLKDRQQIPCQSIVDALIAILNHETWGNRQWTITAEDRWSLFSCAVYRELLSPDLASLGTDLYPSSFNSVEAVEYVLDALLKQDIPMEHVCSVLDNLSSWLSLLREEVDGDWLSPWYCTVFLKALNKGDAASVLKFLCQWRVHSKNHPLLTEAGADSLISTLRMGSHKLAQCLAMLLSSKPPDADTAGLGEIEGDANTLALLLYLYPSFPLESMLKEKTWLIDIVRRAPPHPGLADDWIPNGENDEEPPCPDGEELLSQPASGDGWDIDEELDFEEVPPPQVDIEEAIGAQESGGWSDIDDLEVALQGDTDAEAPAADKAQAEASASYEKESKTAPQTTHAHINIREDLPQEETLFISACCFSSVVASLVQQGRLDIAASILAEKLNLHSSADVLTCGGALVKNYLKACTKAPQDASTVYETKLKASWSGAVLRELIMAMPSVCSHALAALDSHE